MVYQSTYIGVIVYPILHGGKGAAGGENAPNPPGYFGITSEIFELLLC